MQYKLHKDNTLATCTRNKQGTENIHIKNREAYWNQWEEKENFKYVPEETKHDQIPDTLKTFEIYLDSTLLPVQWSVESLVYGIFKDF